MFSIEMLPAQQGDALWIEYGQPNSLHRVLIDGGTPPTYSLLRRRIGVLAQSTRAFDLLIVSHIDTDHIGGALKLFADNLLGADVADVWFNDWHHLPECPVRGPIDGAILAAVLETTGIEPNRAFNGAAVRVPSEGPLPSVSLPGGMIVTVLSPGTEQLANLQCTWNSVLRKAGLDPHGPSMDELAKRARSKGVEIPRGRAANVEELAETPFVPDRARANGSTIAVLAEYEGKSCLLAGDGFAHVITSSLQRLARERGQERVALDAMKLPHHGSKRNVSVDLLRSVQCGNYLFSSDGSVFGHPDREAVARVVRYGGPNPTLTFNYRSEQNWIWADNSLMERCGYRVLYPSEGREGVRLEL